MADRERYQSQDDRDDGWYRRNRDWDPREDYRRAQSDDYRRAQHGERGDYRDRDSDVRRSPSDYGYGVPEWRRAPSYYGYGGYEPQGYERERDDERRSRFDRDYSSGYGDPNYGRTDYFNRGIPQRHSQRDWSGDNEQRQEGQRRWQRGRDEGGFMQHLRDAGQHLARNVKRMFRGPKGYKRSDERIREDVSDRLGQNERLDCSDVEVMVSNAEVTLTGTVQSRYEKYLIEEIADDVSGVNDVHNQLRVKREQPGATPASTESNIGAGASTTEAGRARNARA